MQRIPWEKIKDQKDKKGAEKPFNTLYGFLKGIKVTEKEFKAAEKSLFPYGTK